MDRGLNDIRDGPVSRRALGRGARIRGLRLRTSGAAGPWSVAIINGVVGAREQSVARQTEPRVDVQVREAERSERATQVSRGASATRRAASTAMQRFVACMPPSVENRVKRGGWRAAMTGAGASSDIVPWHANRVRHTPLISRSKARGL